MDAFGRFMLILLTVYTLGMVAIGYNLWAGFSEKQERDWHKLKAELIKLENSNLTKK